MIIRNIFNCISIHNGGGIVYLSMMHSEIDKKGNLVFLDYRAKNDLLPFINAETIYFRKNIFRNLKVFKDNAFKRAKIYDIEKVLPEYIKMYKGVIK